ncbi:homoserine kinase [Microlunatus phosphovorus NM-1]|uniref:Homoserine kinase n=1 Tax=Microlunatus phosphovorus (strain ATCC 700054 / DSM 10555 / JCM 9379 / NBRC 101784 / NCIMB 13414 / VKM Ac-1990 / NM-1) TaxID=1032480 RepID=F5XKH7_MICPN|nr:homoserine kinase [Microlunatus phosphovorus]BAK36049.1 homoserine kinase [Microlunatus phosphovorus NM-1]
MSLPAGREVVVEVPATSANLGPGFDCFGLSLDWYERVTVRTELSGYHLEVTGEGADQVPRDESHLIIRSALLGLADLGAAVSGLGLTCHNTIPHGRGLGSSSAAIVAGLVAARGLAGLEPDREWTLRHATAIEGHPDNVAAAIYGGFVLAYEGRDGVAVVNAPVADELALASFTPSVAVATKAARALLPERVPHVDAAANAARAALLVEAIGGRPELLWEATRDWLHQEYRRPAMPKSLELLTQLRSNGLAAVISGAGPTVLILGTKTELDAAETAGWVPGADGFRVRRGRVGSGARVADVIG